LGFDVSKPNDDTGVLDSDAASPDRRIPNATARTAGTNAAGARLTDLSVAQERCDMADLECDIDDLLCNTGDLLCNPADMMVSTVTEKLLRDARMHEEYARLDSPFVYNSMPKRVAKLGPLAVAESQTSAKRKASTARSIADSLGNHSSLEASTRRWQSIYGGELGNAAITQDVAIQQSLAGQYASQVEESLNIRSTDIGTERAWDIWSVVRLLRLARQAYEASCGVGDEGGYEACALFLDEIGADRNSGDNILSIKELLEPTFGPEEPGHRRRPDRRKDWWTDDFIEAKRWLKGRLRDRNDESRELERRRKGELISYVEEDREEGELSGKHELSRKQESQIVEAGFSEVLDFVLRESARQEIEEILSERQYQTLMLILEQYKYEEIAEMLRIRLNTVKSHAFRMRNNSNLLDQPELLEALLG
jgi:DNA-directed RNA polymerase specialized sigma24 family protein